jgi:SnoaL-like protein
MTSVTDYAEIHHYLNRFWAAMDRCDYNEILDGLTADCRWFRDRWREGRTDILESLNQRPALVVSRHNVCNLVLDRTPEGYDCAYGLIIFGFPRETVDQKPPYKTSGPRMGDWQSKLVNLDGRWLASEIRANLVFERM